MPISSDLIYCDTRFTSAPEVLVNLPELLPNVAEFTMLVYEPYPSLDERRESEGSDPSVFLTYNRSNELDGMLSVSNEWLNNAWLKDLTGSLEESQVLGLCSKCLLDDGSEAHLPLMDLRLPVSPENQEWVARAMQMLGQKRGFLLNSGRSYHYLGLETVDERAFIAFLGGCLLLGDRIDSRYIGHRLIAMNAILRMTACPRKPKTPTVVARL